MQRLFITKLTSNLDTRPLIIPPVGDQPKRKEYFARCDEIIQSQPKTPQEYDELLQVVSKLSSRQWAAAQVVIDEDLIAFSDKERGSILGEANKVVYAAAIARGANNPALSPHAMHAPPQNLVITLNPNSAHAIGEDLLNKIIRRHDSNGKIASCTVYDVGTSRLKGDCYFVGYDNGAEMEITASEMKDILDNHIAD